MGTLAASRPPPCWRGASCLVIVRFHRREKAIRRPSVASLRMPSSQPLCLPSLKGGDGVEAGEQPKALEEIVGMPRMLADPARQRGPSALALVGTAGQPRGAFRVSPSSCAEASAHRNDTAWLGATRCPRVTSCLCPMTSLSVLVSTPVVGCQCSSSLARSSQ